jgi:hypothetical protein
MPKCVIVTAAETGYFKLLKDLLASLAEFPELAELERCVLDIGLEASQRDWLKAQGVPSIEPAWDIALGRRQNVPHYYKAMTARPFLPRYFSNYDIIVWLDADIWVQMPSYLRHYVTGAERYGFALTAEIDRAYPILFGEYNSLRLLHHRNYYRCFGRRVADQLIQFPVINSGAFAARRDHPIWRQWQEQFRQATQRAVLKQSEQAALNLAIYSGPKTNRPHLLPSLANWICLQSNPIWDVERKKLVEPNLPHEVLGLVHLTGADRQTQMQIRTTTGGQVTGSLTYSGIRALAAGLYGVCRLSDSQM